MPKQNLGPKIPAYPMPITLVGAMLNEKANFLTVAWMSMVSYKPHMIAVTLGNHHATNKGIKANKAFSVNIPHRDSIVKTDYVGIVSAEKVDKSEVFEVFFGENDRAPLIDECPVNIECSLDQIMINGANETFIGKITAVHADSKYMKDGKVDIALVSPLMLSQNNLSYYSLGERLGQAWGIGNEFKTNE